MFSHDRVRPLLDRFVLVRADPRSPEVDKSLFSRYKSTRFVPEIVFVSPDGEVLGRLADRSPAGAARELEAVLSRFASG